MKLTRADELREFRTNGEFSDICVIVEKVQFYLHKFPLYLNSEFFRALCRCAMLDENRVTLREFPGGAATFALVADYCYDVEIDITPSNVVELRCAAEFLQMTSGGNLAGETTKALTKMLRSQPSSVIEILSSACQLGAIADQTNVLPMCFDAIFSLMKKRSTSVDVSEVLLGLPVEWFIGFLIGARDASIGVQKISTLAGQYIAKLSKQHRACIDEYLSQKASQREAGIHNISIEDFGDIFDAILLELPESTELSKIMDIELLCLLYRLAVQLRCKCEGILLMAVSKNLSKIPREILVTMPTDDILSIVEHSVNNSIEPLASICDTIDRYLWERIKQKHITPEEFDSIVRATPKSYRQQHDSLLLIVEELFSTTKLSEEMKSKALDVIDAFKLHEETLKMVSERNVIPSSFILNSSFAVASRLRNELTEAKSKLFEKDHEIRDIHASIGDVIQGQWDYNNVTLNVTPKDTSNTRIQFAKVLPRETSAGLTMEHKVYEGKLTLCVQSREACQQTREAPTKTYLFDPFNEQLILTRSKHDNLMVGEHYLRKKHTKSYWPFNDVASS
ncbi:putative BTB/POZ domain-containing protein At3g08660 [Dendronephthya gigantea]|uniref:putative BTB/POZ domain-containing protein At3g08660 n=1 Tax=Dendronephthya gigantea TaxID=151771 RepID=UPI00106A5481|nr:putative BTB/POZ domain-containing protein At3g08660 [Dendronephthya gigantea]